MRLGLVSHQVGRNDGQGRVNYEIALAALARGYEVTILAERCAPDLAEHLRVQLVALSCERYPTRLLKNLAFALRSSHWLEENGHRLDTLQVNGSITWSPSDLNSAHFVHAGWAQSPYYPFRQWWRGGYAAYQRLNTALNEHWERQAFCRTRTVVAVAERVAAEVRELDLPSIPVAVIHNGVDIDEFCPGPGDRARFALPPGEPLFLFAGDIRTPRKNLDTVLKALQAVPELQLAVAGNAKESPYPEMARRMGLEKRVHFLGMVREMPLLMRSVDALVFPSRYEPFGLVILEAMASGIPVIASAHAGGAEVLGAGGKVLENPEDVAGLSQLLYQFATDAEMRSALGTEARSIALANTWRTMADRYLDLHEKLYRDKIGSPRPR